MTVAIADVGCRGRLDLRIGERNGCTFIKESYCEVPFKITQLLSPRDPSSESDFAHLILMHCTAGIFGGDSLECSIHVEGGARVRITQQSAIKVHPSAGRLGLLTTRIHVASGAALIFDGEPVIPFADSRFSQHTLIEVAPESRLLFWEGLMAGRVGSGERWQFQELSSETRLEHGVRHLVPLFLDRFKLVPKQQRPDSEWAAGKASYLGTGLYFGPDASGIVERLHDVLPEAGVDSPAENLAAVRVAADSGPEYHHCRSVFMKEPFSQVEPTLL